MQRKHLCTCLMLLEKYTFKYVYSIFKSNRVEKQESKLPLNKYCVKNPWKLKVGRMRLKMNTVRQNRMCSCPERRKQEKGQWTIGRVIGLSEEDTAAPYIPHTHTLQKKGQQQWRLPPESSAEYGNVRQRNIQDSASGGCIVTDGFGSQIRIYTPPHFYLMQCRA